MTADLDDDIATTARKLVHRAGGYLRNPVREKSVTCTVCATPVDGLNQCLVCLRAGRESAGLADLVVPLTYGIQGAQSAFLLRQYKDSPDARVRRQQSVIINLLLYLAILLHEECIGRHVRLPVRSRMVVPSVRGRSGVHPFEAITRQMNATAESPRLVAVKEFTDERQVAGERFAVDSMAALRGQHVLILDDTWTTGANAQSAVLSARRAGAASVSVMVVGRWLRPRFSRNAEFIKTRLTGDYDPFLCPVTGTHCP